MKKINKISKSFKNITKDTKNRRYYNIKQKMLVKKERNKKEKIIY